MKDLFVDVQIEYDADALSRQDDPDRFVIDAARVEAEIMCERSKARLRTDRPPEIIVQRAQRKDTKAQVVLVATRWAVVAPENTPTRRV